MTDAETKKEEVKKTLEGSELDKIKGPDEIRTIELPAMDMDRLARAHKFDPANLTEALQLAEILQQLGPDMVPKEIVGKPAAIITRIMQGNEIGLPAMTSLHAIVMINGRPCVWGDVALALYTAHPNYVRHTEQFVDDGGPAGLTAVCVVQCRNGSTFTGSFSAADAAKARLDSRDTYKNYLSDMLMWRARHRAFTPACPGALKNVGIAQMARDDMSVEVIERAEPPKPSLPPKSRTQALKEKIKPKPKPKQEKPRTEGEQPAVTLEEVVEVIENAQNTDALEIAADLANQLEAETDKELARVAYGKRRHQLSEKTAL